MRFALDTNLLVYAFIRDDSDKHEAAARILIACDLVDAIVPAQVLGEFLNVIRRKHRDFFDAAVDQAANWLTTLTVLPTLDEHVLNGAKLAKSHRLQLWDAIIWQVARDARSAVFLTEDMQDGLDLDGMRAMNPFEAANQPALVRLLAPKSPD